MTELGNADERDVGRWANNRVENSRPPLRRRERAMLRFRRIGCLQKFASIHANVHNDFNFRTSTSRSKNHQTPRLDSIGRVVNRCGLTSEVQSQLSANRRKVRLSLTARNNFLQESAPPNRPGGRFLVLNGNLRPGLLTRAPNVRPVLGRHSLRSRW